MVPSITTTVELGIRLPTVKILSQGDGVGELDLGDELARKVKVVLEEPLVTVEDGVDSFLKGTEECDGGVGEERVRLVGDAAI